jgi:glycosyltransferase involved in cell wall biosynthesis
VPEIVEPGVTGFHADDAADLAPLVPKALELDRSRVRARARQRWDHRRMVDDYEAIYARVARRREVQLT